MTNPTARQTRPPADIQLSGLGLRLRQWTDDDLPAMVELFDDAEVDRWTPLSAPFDPAAAQTYLDRSRARRTGEGRIQLAITTDGHAPLGEILLFPTDPVGPDPNGRTAELAYAIGPAHRRQGLATRAVRLITDYAYRELAMDQVILRIDADNAASVAVARASGFSLTDHAPVIRQDDRPLFTWLHRRRGEPSSEL